MTCFVWILPGVLCIVLLVSLGLTTLRKGHPALFVFGIFFPLLWIIGAVMAPMPAVGAADARAGLR